MQYIWMFVTQTDEEECTRLPTQALPVTLKPVVMLIEDFSRKVIRKIKSKLKENNKPIHKEWKGEKLWVAWSQDRHLPTNHIFILLSGLVFS